MLTQMNDNEIDAVDGAGFWTDLAVAVAEAVVRELQDMAKPTV